MSITYVRNLQQLVDRMCSHWLSQACWQVATSLQQTCYTGLMNSTALLQVVPTTCYQAASQQLVNKLWVTNLLQLDKITALLQTCWQACCEHNLLTSGAFLRVYRRQSTCPAWIQLVQWTDRCLVKNSSGRSSILHFKIFTRNFAFLML